ncbi:MAG: hypothetical protein ACRDSF_28500 [Pseudonocardiaceae bacterium]
MRWLREQRGWSWADQARALRAVAEQLGVTASASAQLSSLQRGIARWESTASRTASWRNAVIGAHHRRMRARLSCGVFAVSGAVTV